MLIQNRRFANEMQKQGFVNECELNFSLKMDAVTDAVLSKPEERVITLSGPSCAGKTVTSGRIARAVTRAGRRMVRISIDDFYRPRSLLHAEARARGGSPDYDSAAAIDMKSLDEVVKGIYNNEKVCVPNYDFVTGTRIGSRTVNSAEYDVVMFEGIQAIYPEVLELFGGYPYVSISINVRSDICVRGNVFTAREVRLMRRLVRDVRSRGTPPERTFALWDSTVIPNEEKRILPFEDDVQIKIDSLLPYEVNVIRDPLLATLAAVPEGNEMKARADDLAARVAELDPIDPAYVPRESIFCEFLGIKQ